MLQLTADVPISDIIIGLTLTLMFYGHYRSIFNNCDIIGLQSYRIRCKNAK